MTSRAIKAGAPHYVGLPDEFISFHSFTKKLKNFEVVVITKPYLLHYPRESSVPMLSNTLNLQIYLVSSDAF